MSFSKTTRLKKRGVSLLEMLIYVALLAMIFILIVNTMLSFTGSYKQLVANRALEHTAVNTLERITRDIRDASSIDTANSSLGSSLGTLTLVETENSVSTTTKFYIQSGVVKVDVNGVYVGPLSVANSTVTQLMFTKILGGTTNALKIDMTVQGTSGSVTRTKNFHSTIILKGI